MHKAINRGQRHRRFGEHLTPLRERRVGHDRKTLALVALGDQLARAATAGRAARPAVAARDRCSA